MIHPRRVGGDADAALAGMRNQRAYAAEEAIDVAGNPAGRVVAGGADRV